MGWLGRLGTGRLGSSHIPCGDFRELWGLGCGGWTCLGEAHTQGPLPNWGASWGLSRGLKAEEGFARKGHMGRGPALRVPMARSWGTGRERLAGAGPKASGLSSCIPGCWAGAGRGFWEVVGLEGGLERVGTDYL